MSTHEEIDEYDFSCQPQITCPHCLYEYNDSWEREVENDELECRDCGVAFSYERSIVITYTSYK